jgi:hypothetical protein
VVKALCYRHEDRGFETRWSELICFNLPNTSSSTGPRGVTQPLTEMKTRSKKMFLRFRALPVRSAGNLMAIFEPIV